ncbi:unnamed protein product [Caenorhabditis auriculariae]|uniref:G-protein coupled receptors family 1 profile domain-containing protein n=1 Tax=Caenorhabditis auriculariae TaxID=2777116 RepID=A0A8S1HPF7_9PELO|nr:unnamed protein product [Caenorhabditis auriculariae]
MISDTSTLSYAMSSTFVPTVNGSNDFSKQQVWTLYDYMASTIFWMTGGIAIPLNVTLLMLIFFRSPTSLSTYRIFLANVVLSDLVFSISATMAQIRIIPNKWAFAYVSLGPAGRFFGSQGSYFAYCVMLHSLFYMFLCFPISFGFRYWILVRPIPENKSCILLCLGLWSIALAQHILFILSESPVDEIRAYLKINKPQYDLDAFPVSGNHMINSPLTSITLATIVLPMFPIYVLVIFFYKKVHHYLMHNTRNMSIGTLKGHRRLIEVLTIQASLPLFFIFPPITLYGLYHLEFIEHTAIEYLVYTLFSFLPMCSPIVTLVYIKPYNTAFRRIFCLPLRRVEDVGGTATTYMEKENTQYSSHAS